MTSRDFCYWLQGYFEINDAAQAADSGMTFDQAKTIRKHLNLVFLHEIDPLTNSETTTPPAVLDAAHHGGFPPFIDAQPKMRC